MDRRLAGPSDAMHIELENVNTKIIPNVDGEVDDNGLKLPNRIEDRTAVDQTKGPASGKILPCEDTEIVTLMHDYRREQKEDSLTAFDTKDSEDFKNNKDKKDSITNEIQENHNGQNIAVDEKNKNKKKTENVEGEIVLKFKDQIKLKLHDVCNEGNQKYIYKCIARIHRPREPMEEESFDNYFAWIIICINFSEISIEVFAWIQSLKQTFSTDCIDMHELTTVINSLYSSSKLQIEPDLSSRRTGHMSKFDSSYAWMTQCSQTQSEQHFVKEAVTIVSETSDINAMCDLSSKEVARMKNTQDDTMLIQKHRDTGQHTRTVKEMNTISFHISLKGNINDKILSRQALNSIYWQEHLTSQVMLVMYMQSSYEKERLDAINWYLEWGSDHPLFRYTIWHVNAVRFGAEGIPPRPHIQLPAPALPLTRLLEPINVPAARTDVTTEEPNFTASSAQEQSPNQSSETENTFSSRARVEELRPSNDDQKEAAALKRTVVKWNVNTDNSGSEETIPRVHCHPVEESAESEANKRPAFLEQLSFPSQTETFIHEWPPYLDQTSQQIADAGSIFSEEMKKKGPSSQSHQVNDSTRKGFQDIVQGFVCNDSLNKGDPDDDSWVEYALWFPQCTHMCLDINGEEFINLVQRMAEESNEDNYTLHRGATWGRAEDSNTTAITVSGHEEADGACGEEVSADLEDMRERRTSPEHNLCKLCQDETICTVFLPCDHSVCCSDCAVSVMKCPICDTLIRGFITVY